MRVQPHRLGAARKSLASASVEADHRVYTDGLVWSEFPLYSLYRLRGVYSSWQGLVETYGLVIPSPRCFLDSFQGLYGLPAIAATAV